MDREIIQTRAGSCAGHREYLRGRVVALAERLQSAEGDEALQIVDQLLDAAHQLIEISARGAR